MAAVPIHICDSATKLDARHLGAVVICGSHGGIYPACLAARAGVRAIILNDAGVGLDQAGIGSLGYAQALGMAAATCSHASARIGDAADMQRRGRISHANAIALSLGVQPGEPVTTAATKLAFATPWHGTPPPYQEARTILRHKPGAPRLICIDSASLVLPEDAGQIVITGSHGGMLGGRPELALQVDALAALFNDAGIGIDDAGTSRLKALDTRHIAAATVAATTARIGDGRSTYHAGILSRVNPTAHAHGARIGMQATTFVDLMSTAHDAI
jgi:hypothetical protein